MTFEEFKNRYHITFTQQQFCAVQSVEGSTLLLAVPGSGKAHAFKNCVVNVSTKMEIKADTTVKNGVSC